MAPELLNAAQVSQEVSVQSSRKRCSSTMAGSSIEGGPRWAFQTDENELQDRSWLCCLVLGRALCLDRCFYQVLDSRANTACALCGGVPTGAQPLNRSFLEAAAAVRAGRASSPSSRHRATQRPEVGGLGSLGAPPVGVGGEQRRCTHQRPHRGGQRCRRSRAHPRVGAAGPGRHGAGPPP